MKIALLFFICFVASITKAQTPIIAHKSHSGASADFFIDPSANFGIPSPQLVQVIRLNDSTSIEVYDNYHGYYEYDTIYKDPSYANYNLDLDSIAQSPYHSKVEYLNFKKSSKSVKPLPPGNKNSQINKVKPDLQIEPAPETAPKKKKRSALFFIFWITGCGLLLFRLVSRLFTPQISS